MRVGSLFAGIGGADLALESLGCETVWHAEVDPYASKVFAKRFPRSVNLGDVTTISHPPAVDVLVGGFPCQGLSDAGLKLGLLDPRSGLWAEYARLIGEVMPQLVLIENVAALLRRGLDVVLRDLDQLGYAVEWDCIPAAAVGAPHLRDRIWLVAYPEDTGPLHVFGESRLEKAVGTVTLPPSSWPRAGRMEQGAVYVSDPVAPRKTKRLNPGSAWVGVRLSSEAGWWHQGRPVFPTPEASDGSGGRVASEYGGTRPSGAKRSVTLATAVAHDVPPRGLWPTPRASWNENRTRKPAPSHGVTHGRLLAGEANRVEAEAGRPTGLLSPDWVEWLMGFPLGWTDLGHGRDVHLDWDHEPDLPRVKAGVEDRRERLTCLGNALVPQVMRWVAWRALRAVGA